MSLVVRPINDLPLAQNLTATTDEDTAVPIHLAATDAEDAVLAYSVVTPPANGTLTGTAPNFTYTPAPNFNGSDRFTYTASDAATTSAPASVTISVTSQNDAPSAVAASFTLNEDATISINLSGLDPDGDAITYQIRSQTSHGTLTGVAPELTYTPAGNFNGTDSFTFTVSDSTLISQPAVITFSILPVDDVPVATALSATVLEDTSTTINLLGSDPDADAMTYTVITQPQHGTLTGTAPALVYTPASNFNGIDSFSFIVNDGTTDSSPATAAIMVTPVDDRPVATNATYTLRQRSSANFTLVGTSVDGDALSYAIQSQPSHGVITGSSPEFTYTPEPTFTGTENIQFVATSNRSGLVSVPATVTFQVTRDNLAPLAPDLDVTIDGAPVAIILPGSDPENLPLVYTVGTQAASLVITTGTAPALTLARRFSTASQTSFTYTVRDDLGLTATGTVRVKILLPNRIPSINGPVSLFMAEDATMAFRVVATDPDNDPLTYFIDRPVGSPCLIEGSGPEYLLRCTPNFTGTATFTARVTDGRGGSATRVINLTVSVSNDAPVATLGDNTTLEDTPHDLVISAVDPEGSPVTYALVSPPLHGSLTGTLPNLRYTPQANFNGADSFVFSVSDGSLSAPVTVPITVTAVNDPPVAERVTEKFTGLTTAFVLRGTDVDGDPLTYRLLTQPSIGSATISGNLLTFTGTEPFLGNLRLSYVANDGAVDSTPASIVLTGGVVPEARILSPIAGARLPMGESIPVKVDASDADGTIIRYELFANGASVATATMPDITWTPSQNGPVALTVKVTDDSALTFTSAPLHLTITGSNQAPVVFAGSDRNIFALNLGPNLIKNGSCELPLDANGNIPFWDAVEGYQDLTQSNSESFTLTSSQPYFHFPSAADGTKYFGPKNPVSINLERKTAEVAQVVSLVPGDPNASNHYLFSAKLYGHTYGSSNKDLRQPQVELEFLDAAGVVLTTHLLQGKIPDNVWYPVMLDLERPVDAVSLKVTLIDHREPGAGSGNHSLIDDVSLCNVVSSSPTTLQATVEDDGLPASGSLSHVWTQIAGPSAHIVDPTTLNTPVEFSGYGEYLFKLSASDGETSASDTVAINVGSIAGENAPPRISLASEMAVTVGVTKYPLVATVTDDGKPGNVIYHYWEQLSGPSDAAFADPRSASTTFSVSVPGAYVFRLTSHDGSLAASAEIAIQANCELTRQPIDLCIIIDHSGSMFGPEPGVITDYDPRTPIYQARKMVGALLDSLDPALDRVSINKNDSVSYNAMPFTSDFELAKQKIIMPEGEAYYESSDYGSFVITAISRAVGFVKTNSRPNSKKIILHINDGVAGVPEAPSPSQIAGFGITTMSISMANMKNDPISRYEISNFVSPSHAFFVNSLSDPEVVANFLRVALSPLCRGFNANPVVHAGSAKYLPTPVSVYQPDATVNDDQEMESLSLTWEQVSGPVPAQISDSHALRPSIRFSQAGSYLFRLTAFDGTSSASDTVLVQIGTTDSVPTPSGMIAYWAFDGSMRDVVGNRTLAPKFPYMPPVYTADSHFGQALATTGRTYPFEQTDGPLFDLNGSVTDMAVSFWFKADSTNSSGTILGFEGYSKEDGGNPYAIHSALGISYNLKTIKLNLLLQDPVTHVYYTTTFDSQPGFGSIETARWNHIVINYEKSTRLLSAYINGILTNSTAYNNGYVPVFARNGQSISIGSCRFAGDWSAQPPAPFHGIVDDVAVFNRSLNTGDVANLANRNSGLTPPALNPAPIVDAGQNRVVSLSQPVMQLEGLVTDDSPTLDIGWSLLSGPVDGFNLSHPELPNSLVTFSKPGIYTFELRANDGYHSEADTVEFRVDQPCQSPLPANAFLWLKADGNPKDSVGTNDLTWLNQPGYVDGKTGKAFNFTGTNGLLESKVLNISGSAGLTFEGWFRDNSNDEGDQRLFEISSSGKLNDPLALQVVSRLSSGKRYIQLSGSFLDSAGAPRNSYFFSNNSFSVNSFPLGQFYHLAVSISRTSGVRFYMNGVLSSSQPVTGNLVLPVNPILRLGGANSAQVYPKLTLDELTVYTRSLDLSEILSIYQAGSSGKCPPWAQSPLNSGFVDAGQSVTLPQAASHVFAGSYEPNDFAANPAVSWSLQEGPATVSLAGGNTLSPSGSFSVPGRYVFKLSVTDGTKTGSDTVIVDLSRAANTAPVVDWTPPVSLQLPLDTLTLAPTVTDDGLPINTLHSSWRMVSGPASVSFSELTDTANPHDVTARFSAPGSYEVEFLVSDDLLTATRRATITVLAESAPPAPNTAPTFSLGPDIIASARTVELSPTVLDDGKPNHTLTASWDYDRGPAAPRFDLPANATGPQASITFPLPGIYEIRLTVSDGELSSSDVVRVEVPASVFGPGDGLNSAPELASIAPQVITRPATSITLQPEFTDADGPADVYGYSWEQVGGPAALVFSNTESRATTITFAELGTYVVKFTLTDGPYIRSNYVTLHHLAAPNASPTLSITPPGGTAQPMSTVTLTANATDDGIPGTLTYEWDWLSSPSAGAPVFSNATAAETQVTFPAAGDYVLYCRVSDGQLSTHQTISYQVVGDPFFAILTPQDGSVVSDNNVPAAQIRAFQDGGGVDSVTLALDGMNLGQAHLETDTVDYFLNLPPMLHGSHTLTATATFGDGTVLTRTSNFQLADYAEEALVLEIDSPHEFTADITAPTPVIGTVDSPRLKNYTLDIAPVDAPLAKRVIATGTSQVTSGTLGTLDPTLLQNGLHILTLSGTTTNGLYASTSERVMIDGNMKLGQFSLAFQDISIDLPGTPLTVTRTYDSRDAKGGDFGPGWSLATSSVKVRKTRPLDLGWEQTSQGGGFVTNRVYLVQPSQRKRVIVSFPGGRTEIFETGIRAAVPVSAEIPYGQRYAPVYGAKYVFTPVDNSQGKLEVEGDTEILWQGESNDFVNLPTIAGQFTAFDDATSNPSRFRYTEPGGASYIIDETQGLMSIADTNGNTVTVNRSGVHHSAGESLVFTRDTAGRITQITDPTGKKVTYQYDAQGRLITFTNRTSNTNRFLYANTAFPHYLTEIDDGTGVQAIRTAYDAGGRMISQTDATGKTIAFAHDVSNRRESATDRLGHVTTHEFDDFGNVTRTTDALGGVTTRTYDANDNETGTTTPLGFTTTRVFDARNNLLRETDPLGNVSRYTYDSEKRPLTIADALDHNTAIVYNASGNLASMTDPAGTPTAFTYTGTGNIATLVDANGTTTSYTHDAKGHEKTMSVTASNGSVLSSEAYDYDSAGNRIRSIVFDGARYLTTNYEYDGENRLTRITYPDGTLTVKNYDSNGKLYSESSPVGTTSYTLDTRGNVTKTTYPGTYTGPIRITRSGYDAEGRMTSSTDMAGATTYTLYDALGRATATIQPDATMPATILTEVADIAAAPALADNPRTLTTYDADGRVTASTDALGNTTTFEYDDAGRRTAVIDALGNRMTYAYDAAGRQISSTDARGTTTTFTYDSAGRQTSSSFFSVNQPSTLNSQQSYDTLGRRITSTDAEGNVTRFAYDPQGRLLAVTDALGGITRYGYDWRGLQTSQTDALGRTTRYEYDVMGRRTARILPEGQREEMTYNNLGQLTAQKDFNGQTITRTYEDNTQNLLSIVAPSAHPSLTLSHAPARYDFTYDVLGRRTGATVKNKLGSVLSSETYSYDIRSQLTGYTGPSGSIGYGYDAAGNLAGTKSATAGGYDVSYDYDALNRLTDVYRGQEGVDPNATGLAAYNYDANGNLNGVGYANGVQHAYTYNALNRLTALDVSSVSSSTIPNPRSLQGYAYTLNKNGHRTQISELSGRTVTNTFDKLLRLTSESISQGGLGVPPQTSPPAGTLSYSYDSVGNRTSRTTSGPVAQIIPSQSQSFTANDRLTSDTYDANGNTTQSVPAVPAGSSSSVTDVYSFDNKLIRRTTADGKTIDLTYNPDGHRLTKLISQGGLTQRVSNYLTDANNPTGYAQVIEEKDPLAGAGAQLKKVHLYGHDLISSSVSQPSTPNPQLLFYSYDGLGSVRGITDENGELLETYDYDAYGTLIGLSKRNATTGELESSNLTNPANTPTSEFLYTGEQWDADLGMYFLRARYLNTNTGRFHTQDTYEGQNGEPLSLHKYLYANGNPVLFLDPSGNESLQSLTLATSFQLTLGRMAFGAILGGVDGVVNGDSPSGIIGKIVFGGLSGAYGGPLIKAAWKAGGILKYGIIAAGIASSISQIDQIFDNISNGQIGRATWNTAMLSGMISLKRLLSFQNAYKGMFQRMMSSPSSSGVGMSGVIDPQTGLMDFVLTGSSYAPRRGTHGTIADYIFSSREGLLGFGIRMEGGKPQIFWNSGQLNGGPGALVPESMRGLIQSAIENATGHTFD
ncbi:MAG: tandem-95 repeat protein [Luteolibacter sp.]